jgi:hypothetical protein
MHKKELIANLKDFVAANPNYPNVMRWKGQRTFGAFLIYFLENLQIPHDEQYDFWDIEPYIPQLMVAAFEELRTGTDEETVRFRKAYEAETEHEVPNITDLGASDILNQASAIQTTLSFMLSEVTGKSWIEQEIDKYCNAQAHVLQQTFDKFLRLVYCKGLDEIIAKCDKSGMSGRFGKVELRTLIAGGRIMFTFAQRIDENKDSYYKKGDKLYCNEWTVSFVGDDSDPLCLGAGIQSVHCDFRKALDMIEEVINGWPQDPEEQKKLYKADTKIGFG